MQQSFEELSGTIDRFLFQSEDNGFSIFILVLENNSTIVKGVVPNIHAGQQVSVTGSWVTHPKFGKQFDAKTCTAHAPTSTQGLKKYLGSGLIKGIGPSYAEKLVDYFGTTVLDIINTHPQRLAEVPGIGKKRLETILGAWEHQKDISKVMVFLQDKGITTAYAIKIYKAYGNESVAVLTENPYRLADEIWGIGFKIADAIANNLGIAKHSLKRIKAAINFIITTQMSSGHIYIELEELKQNTINLLELEEIDTTPLLKNALHELYQEEKIKLISKLDRHFITLSQYYFTEYSVAQKIKTLLASTLHEPLPVDAIYNKLRAQPSDLVELNEDQQRGILACLSHKITVITGGPGTGKTTLIKKLLSVLDDNYKHYKLAAPTGRAAKRITEGTGRHAVTLHRLLEFDFSTRGFLRNESNALKCDFLIIDEASMIDIFLAHAIVKAMPLHGHLVLIGDIDQLPSVGAGNFLNDLINSNTTACIRLTQIFRQAQNSMIIVNAHRINTGQMPTYEADEDSKKDFMFIKEEDPNNIPMHLQHIFTKTLFKHSIYSSDAMVLIPMNRGIAGTQKLNVDLQAMLNKNNNSDFITYGSTTYKMGDRVMQIKNNYDKHVFNGDIGTIQNINIEDRTLTIQYPEKMVEYETNELDELVLAYAISIHKSQGSEYQAVIIPLFMQHFTLLQRNLVYTAITRAKKLCIFIGQYKALAMAVKNTKGSHRQTFLTEFLTSDLQCR